MSEKILQPEDKELARRVSAMGIRVKHNDPLEMARNMRKWDKGAFGNRSHEEWNHRIPGTNGSEK